MATTSSRSVPELKELLERNSEWAADIIKRDPEFFRRNFSGQKPKILWIGCSDSRVSETSVLHAQPGEVFVHRNIANIYHPEDDSINACLAFGVLSVGIRHVVVAGHTGCVGCANAIKSSAPGQAPPLKTPLQRFLQPVKDLARSMWRDGVEPDLESVVRANVIRQVKMIAASDVVRQDRAERPDDPVTVHGWLYHLENGRIEDLEVSRRA